jgi:hypothetical protein
MADFRIICAVRGGSGVVEAIGYSKAGNDVMYDDQWTLEQARAAIEEGHRLYAVNQSTGAQADLELFKGSVQTEPLIDSLPECGCAEARQGLTSA